MNSLRSASSSVSQEAGSDGYLRSERSAGDELRKRWGQFSGPAKTQCSQQSRAGGFPSYVEMLTCLELASGAVPVTSPTNRATVGQGSPATTGAGARRQPHRRALAEPAHRPAQGAGQVEARGRARPGWQGPARCDERRCRRSGNRFVAENTIKQRLSELRDRNAIVKCSRKRTFPVRDRALLRSPAPATPSRRRWRWRARPGPRRAPAGVPGAAARRGRRRGRAAPAPGRYRRS